MFILFISILFTGPPTKSEWLKEQVSKLRDIKVTKEMLESASPWEYGDEACWIRLKKEGIIPIGKKDWIYVVFHSSHDNEVSRWRQNIRKLRYFLRNDDPPHYPVKDAIIGIDSQGKLYINDGHICGLLYLESLKRVDTLQDFLITNTPDAKQWNQYHE